MYLACGNQIEGRALFDPVKATVCVATSNRLCISAPRAEEQCGAEGIFVS